MNVFSSLPDQLLSSFVTFLETGRGIESAILLSDKTSSEIKTNYDWKVRLHCKCLQPESDLAHLKKCSKCFKFFHPSCLEEEMFVENIDNVICDLCYNPDGSMINELPVETLRKIFVDLCHEKESMHSTLALVCKRWCHIVDNHPFRTVVQQRFLDKDFDAYLWDEETKQKYYYTGFDIGMCLSCGNSYKSQSGYFRDPKSGSVSITPPEWMEKEIGYCKWCALDREMARTPEYMHRLESESD